MNRLFRALLSKTIDHEESIILLPRSFVDYSSDWSYFILPFDYTSFWTEADACAGKKDI